MNLSDFPTTIWGYLILSIVSRHEKKNIEHYCCYSIVSKTSRQYFFYKNISGRVLRSVFLTFRGDNYPQFSIFNIFKRTRIRIKMKSRKNINVNIEYA